MWPKLVVFAPVYFQENFGLLETREDLEIHEIPPKAVEEILDVGVLPGTAGCDE